MGTYNIR